MGFFFFSLAHPLLRFQKKIPFFVFLFFFCFLLLFIYYYYYFHHYCHSPSLGLAIKARTCKGAGQKWSPGIKISCSRKCKTMWRNELPHSQVSSIILGVEVPMDFQIFKKQLQRSKPIKLRSSLYHWKYFGTKMSKMGLHNPFGHLKHKLWPKKGSGIKLAIWLPTIKSWESPQYPCVQVVCDIFLESS